MAAAAGSTTADSTTGAIAIQAEPPILQAEVVAEEAERSRPQPGRRLLAWISAWDTRPPKHIQGRHRPAILALLIGVFRLLDRLAPRGEAFALLRIIGRTLIVLAIVAVPLGLVLVLLVAVSSALYSVAYHLFWSLVYILGIVAICMVLGLSRKPPR